MASALVNEETMKKQKTFRAEMNARVSIAGSVGESQSCTHILVIQEVWQAMSEGFVQENELADLSSSSFITDDVNYLEFALLTLVFIEVL